MPPIPLPPPLDDGVVALRPYAERDIPEILIAFQDDPELHLRLGGSPPPTGAELGRAAELAPAEIEAGTGISLTVLESGADVCRGQINLHKIAWEEGRAELGLWLVPQVRGRGFGRRALALIAGWTFDRLGMMRLELVTEPGNAGMIAAARGVGAQLEGVLRGYTFERGQRVDCAILSLLPSDLGAGS